MMRAFDGGEDLRPEFAALPLPFAFAVAWRVFKLFLGEGIALL
jgi:hypothetical protein